MSCPKGSDILGTMKEDLNKTPRTDALLDNQEFDTVDFDTSCQQLAELCRELERELNEVSYERDKAWDEYFGMKDARDQLRDRIL